MERKLELKHIPWGRPDRLLAMGVCRNIKETMYSMEVGYWHPVWSGGSGVMRWLPAAVGILIGVGYVAAVAVAAGAA